MGEFFVEQMGEVDALTSSQRYPSCRLSPVTEPLLCGVTVGAVHATTSALSL